MANSSLPSPLSPPDCDLRGYDYMPLFGHRLFSSSFNDRASDAEFRAAMRLWWAAWQQCPAGSLPDDDTALARMADFGRDVKGWKKVRQNALHAFILCSDGRLYHPMLCGAAQEAFERRRKDRDRKAKMREAKRDGGGTDGGSPAPSPRPVPRDNDGTEHGTGRGTSAGPTQDVLVERRGEDRILKKEIPAASSRTSHETPPQHIERDASARPIRHLNPAAADPREAWHHLADRNPDGSPKVQGSSPIVMDGRTFEVPPEDVGRAIVGGSYIDVAAQEVCGAAGINEVSWRGDWKPLTAWLRDDIELAHITAVITRIASRPGYQPPGSLAYFDQAIRSDGVRSRA